MPLSVNSQTKHNSSQLPCQLYVSVFAWVCCSEYVTSNGWFRPGEVYQVSMHKNTYTPSADVPPQVLLCAVIRSYSQGRKKFISLLWYLTGDVMLLLSISQVLTFIVTRLPAKVFSSCLAIVSAVMDDGGLFLWPALQYGTGYQTVWEIHLSAEAPSSIHWRRFYFQLTYVHSTLELFGWCALQIY